MTTISQIVHGGYCIGCGACAVLEPGRYGVQLDSHGCLQASILSEQPEVQKSPALKVCPFSPLSPNEDELAAIFLPDAKTPHPRIGSHISCFVGRVAEETIYKRSSSGGIGRWLLAQLLLEGDVTHVIHVVPHKPEDDNFPLFKYALSSSPYEVMATAKSAYYPVEMSDVLRRVLLTPGKYAITGVPCFIKAVRNLCLENETLRERIQFTIGIVCGHLKSAFYAEMIGWQLGVKPEDLRGVDFRVKIPGRQANEKGVSATSVTGETHGPKTVQWLYGTDFGLGYFKYLACDYCDDVLAETADVSIGDAWLPQYLAEGTSLVVSRNKRIQEIIKSGICRRELQLRRIVPERAAASQDGGLRHRREGLAYRLLLKETAGKWIPPKRVGVTCDLLSSRQQKIHKMRLKLASESFVQFCNARGRNDWELFRKKMDRWNKKYSVLCRGYFKNTFIYRVLTKIFRELAAVFKNK